MAWKGWARWTAALIVGSLAACTTVEVPQTPPGPVADNDPLPPAIQRATARWVPVRWSEVPGWGTDQLHEVWSAWVRGCEKPAAGQAALCAELRPLTMADAGEQRAWIERRFRPFRVTDTEGRPPPGLLTGYYEPVLNASRLPTATQRVPLYGVPPGLRAGQPWYSRQDIDTLPAAQTALKDRAIAWLADPIDALVLQIQGSGRINLREADGSIKTVRLTFAGHNGHPYQSVGKWLLDQGDSRGSGWEGIRAWAAQNPKRLNEMLWSNPRTVFFKEVPLNALDAKFGPSGAQGVALTPGRSIAVDPQSVPLRHTGLDRDAGAGPEPAEAGDGAGHRWRDHGRGARRPVHRLGQLERTGLPAGFAAEAAAADVGALAALNAGGGQAEGQPLPSRYSQTRSGFARRCSWQMAAKVSRLRLSSSPL